REWTSVREQWGKPVAFHDRTVRCGGPSPFPRPAGGRGGDRGECHGQGRRVPVPVIVFGGSA
ncbi:hypothetical protein, partial [Streptomyces sp. NPDC002599]|uniref:hypothetical protein n=1 Tax=Streptomyces sp. NPDC002599 TaxID=3154421 RepID=UPI00332A4941